MKTVMVLPIAAVLGEMLVTCGDYMEPQLHSFKKFSEELGKLLRAACRFGQKASQECRCTPRVCLPTPTDIGISLETHNRFAGHYAEKRQRKQTQQRSQLKLWTRAVSIGSRLSCPSTCLVNCDPVEVTFDYSQVLWGIGFRPFAIILRGLHINPSLCQRPRFPPIPYCPKSAIAIHRRFEVAGR